MLLRETKELRSLATDARRALARRLEVFTARPGDCLLEAGSTSDTTLYLLEGRLELQAKDGRRRIVDAHEPAARMPISPLRPSPYRVLARSPVRYLTIHDSLLTAPSPRSASSAAASLDGYLVEEAGFEELTDDHGQAILVHIVKDLQRDRLMLLSPPRVAEETGRAIVSASANEARLVDALMGEPVLAGKMIRLANRVYGITSVSTVEHAVRLLGADRVRSVAIRCVLQHSLRSRNAAILRASRKWWESSLRISLIGQVLARLSERFDPDIAATLGLLDRIGEAALLSYASRFDDRIDSQALQEMLTAHTDEVTRLITASGYCGMGLRAAMGESPDPVRPHADAPDYADLVVVARRCAELVDCDEAAAPPADLAAAVKRLGLGEPSPELRREIMAAHTTAKTRARRLMEYPR